MLVPQAQSGSPLPSPIKYRDAPNFYYTDFKHIICLKLFHRFLADKNKPIAI